MEEYIFDLDNPVDSVDSVPEDLRGFFEKSDEGYVVAEAHKPIAQRLNGLTKNLRENRSKRTEAGKDAGKAREMANAFKSVFEGIEGIDEVTPENVKAVMDDLTARAAKGGRAGEEARAQIEAVKKQMAAQHQEETAKLTEQVKAKDAQIEKLVVGSQVTDAMAKHEVVGGEVFRAYLNQRVAVEAGEDGVPVAVVKNEDGTTVYNGAGDPMTVDEFVKSLKGKEDFAAFFKSTRVPGTGTKPSNGQRRQQQGVELTAQQKIANGLKGLRAR